MPLRFWRRVKVAPGVTLNLSRSGTSVSLGPRGAKTTIGHGQVRQTVGLPGTGLFSTRTVPRSANPTEAAVRTRGAVQVAAAQPPVPWQATAVVMAFLTGIMIGVYPGSALAFAVVGTPIAFALAWLLRRHPLALAVAIGVAIVALVGIAIEVVVGALRAGASSGKAQRRRRF